MELRDQKLTARATCSRFPLGEFRCVAGLYVISGEPTPEKGSLYAGVTLDLERRLRLLLDGCRLRGSWKAYAPAGRLHIRTLPLDVGEKQNWISDLAPHQARVVANFAPLLNFKILDKGDPAACAG
jgi:hypothetical protein